jgi:hypothetical protein
MLVVFLRHRFGARLDLVDLKRSLRSVILGGAHRSKAIVYMRTNQLLDLTLLFEIRAAEAQCGRLG